MIQKCQFWMTDWTIVILQCRQYRYSLIDTKAKPNHFTNWFISNIKILSLFTQKSFSEIYLGGFELWIGGKYPSSVDKRPKILIVLFRSILKTPTTLRWIKFQMIQFFLPQVPTAFFQLNFFSFIIGNNTHTITIK